MTIESVEPDGKDPYNAAAVAAQAAPASGTDEPDEAWLEEIFRGLREVEACAFPKRCEKCGHSYASMPEFLAGTELVRVENGLQDCASVWNEAGVALYRNCACGSTLTVLCQERRDTSELGLRRRTLFGQVLNRLVEHGIDHAIARRELLKVLNGFDSEILGAHGISLERLGRSRLAAAKDSPLTR